MASMKFNETRVLAVVMDNSVDVVNVEDVDVVATEVMDVDVAEVLSVVVEVEVSYPIAKSTPRGHGLSRRSRVRVQTLFHAACDNISRVKTHKVSEIKISILENVRLTGVFHIMSLHMDVLSNLLTFFQEHTATHKKTTTS